MAHSKTAKPSTVELRATYVRADQLIELRATYVRQLAEEEKRPWI